MRRAILFLMVAALTGWGAAAQSSGGAQTRPNSQGEPVEKAGKPGKASAHAQGSGSTAANASAQAGQQSLGLSEGTAVEAALSSTIDARHNKVGDKVTARTTQAVKQDGKVVVPKGTKLVGHVTEVKARGKGEAQSAVGIIFDHAILKGGQEVPVNFAIQAIAAAESSASSSLGESSLGTSTMGSAGGSGRASGSGGGLVSGVGSTVSGVTNTAGSVAGGAAGAAGATVGSATSAGGGVAGGTAGAVLNSSSTGVIGLQGLSLNAAASNSTQGSVIASSTRNVRLESGTRMMLRVQGSAQSQ